MKFFSIFFKVSKQYDKQKKLISSQFTSNMCAVLNDPRKDRTKTNYLFTKTWGSDFNDNFYASKSSVIKRMDFNDYIETINEV